MILFLPGGGEWVRLAVPYYRKEVHAMGADEI